MDEAINDIVEVLYYLHVGMCSYIGGCEIYQEDEHIYRIDITFKDATYTWIEDLGWVAREYVIGKNEGNPLFDLFEKDINRMGSEMWNGVRIVANDYF